MHRELTVCFPAFGIHEADSGFFCIFPYPRDVLLNSHAQRPSPICQTPYWELLSYASGSKVLFLHKMLPLLAGSLEVFQRPLLTPSPFQQEGTLYYFPSSAPSPRHYLSVISLKNSV